MEDEMAIRHLVATYADAVNRQDQFLWNSTLSEEVSWTLPGKGSQTNTTEGKAAVIGLWNSFMGNVEFVIQLVHQGTVVVDGSRATGRWYLTERLRVKGSGQTRTTIGRYTDDYVKQDGQWYFAKRVFEVLDTVT